MEVMQVLHMNGGGGEASYAQNSLLQRKVIATTKPIKEGAMEKIYKSFPLAKCITIADLGCSSGPNTLVTIHEIVRAIYKARRSDESSSDVSIQVFLNDLPGNDFNSVFKALPSFKKELDMEIRDVFIYWVPGSFYDRLFLTNTLHFVHSSYSLHWLSQVPRGIGRSQKNSICLSRESPESVKEAYYKQFQADFGAFLRYRSEELMGGGCIVLTLLGRSDDPFIKGSAYIWEILGIVLRQLTYEGLIKEEDLEEFNIPLYTPSASEMEMEVKKQGSFEINCLEVWEMDWEAAVPVAPNDAYAYAFHVGKVMKFMRAVSEPMLVDHFGRDLIEEVFKRYAHALGECMSKERTFFTNLTLSAGPIV